ncbi:hypothetical protein KAR91_74195 [Candidatus Pacearchaeota archaeon]|nr:hypothetical protein [Candidatus Pacearchaeota archaeon]
MNDEKNPEMLLQTFPNDVLLKIANKEIDTVGIAKELLKDQGLPAGNEHAIGIKEKELEEITERHLGVKTLKTRNSDSLDFYEVSVWDLKKALLESYELGRKETK